MTDFAALKYNVGQLVELLKYFCETLTRWGAVAASRRLKKGQWIEKRKYRHFDAENE
jgi:hypothetical protein